jgi:hypothetical protein
MQTSPVRVRPWAIVEITSESDEGERTELIRAAYNSSRSGVVALVLRGITSQSVDRVLDAVVDAKQGVRGVVYVRSEKETSDVVKAAGDNTLVVATTDSFRSELLRHGIDVSVCEDAVERLFASAELH